MKFKDYITEFAGFSRMTIKVTPENKEKVDEFLLKYPVRVITGNKEYTLIGQEETLHKIAKDLQGVEI